MNIQLANWPAPANITALCTTRLGGYSLTPYDSNNLGLHVGDNPEHVQKNRQQLIEQLELPNEPVWLNQTHSTLCINPEYDNERTADASTTRSSEFPLAVLTADCLPITLCNKQGTEIAAIHAGWKGLAQGIIEQTIKKMSSKPSELLAWIGPAISQEHYETGSEVYQAFTTKYPQSCNAFIPNQDKWMANLAHIAEIILQLLGVGDVYQSNLCTYKLKKAFFSYRRTPQTGRIATLIWFNNRLQD
jgi:YfiH family protein